MDAGGDHGAPYWATVHLIRIAAAYRGYVNGRLQLLGVDQTTMDGGDFFDVLATVLAEGIASGELQAMKKLGELVQQQVALTPDREMWGMDAGAWDTLPSTSAPRSDAAP